MSTTTGSAASTRQPEAPPAGRSSGVTLAVIVSFALLIGVDSTIVNTALPQVQQDLGFSNTDLSWILNAYTLTFGGLLLLGGRLGDVVGRRSTFVAGVLIFTLASLLGGLAPSAWWLIGSRALQGAGAALAAPAMMALIVTNFQDAARAKALAMFSGVMGAGASVGLIAGGLLTSWISWRWVLIVNVPLGIVIALLAPRYVKQPDRHPTRLDVPGALLGTLGMGALVYGFIRAASDGWRDNVTLAGFGLAVLLLIAFLVVETRTEHAIVPLRLLADGTRAAAFTTTLLLSAAMFGVLFLLTHFLQDVLELSPIRAGLAFLPMTLGQFAAVRLVPRLLPRLGAKILLVGGAALVTAGMAWLTQLSATSDYFTAVCGPLLLIGVGAGVGFVTLNVTIMSGVAAREAGAASGLLQTIQWLGGTLGLAVWVTIFGATIRDAHPAATSAVEAGHEVLALGVSRAFLGAALAAAATLILVPIALRKRAAAPAAS